MKKILKTLLMLTCVLGLTACGSNEEISQHQQDKIAQAESMAPQVVQIMSLAIQSGTAGDVLENYNNMELGDWFSYNFSSFTQSSYSFACEGKGVRSGVTSFETGLEQLGAITEIGEPESDFDDDTIIVTVPVTCENGTGSVEIIFSNDIYFNMSACTFNLNESMSDLMVRAALNTVIGMGTVFAVLILIGLIIGCFGFIPKIEAAIANKNQKKAVEEKAQTVILEKTEEVEELADDTELVAVIAAAIAAYEGTSADGFQVRSIKRANTKKWQRA